MIFAHTYKEPGLWRGWLKSGQSLEYSVGKSGVGIKVGIHSNDADQGDRHLNIAWGTGLIFIPLGIVRSKTYQVGEEPGWGFMLGSEYLDLEWGRWRKFWNPIEIMRHAWDYKGADGMLAHDVGQGVD